MGYLDQSKYINPITTNKFNYVGRRRNSLAKLCNGVINDTEYSQGIDNRPLLVKNFVPALKNDVNPKFYDLIAVICEYFQSRAVWVKRFIPNTNVPINTFFIVGHHADCFLASRYIAIEINNIETLRFNKQKHYRTRKLKTRRRCRKYGREYRSVNISSSARTRATKVFDDTIKELVYEWSKILELRPINPHYETKLDNIYNYLRTQFELDYGKRDYKHKPNIERAFCRRNKFVRNKIIMGYY